MSYAYRNRSNENRLVVIACSYYRLHYFLFCYSNSIFDCMLFLFYIYYFAHIMSYMTYSSFHVRPLSAHTFRSLSKTNSWCWVLYYVISSMWLNPLIFLYSVHFTHKNLFFSYFLIIFCNKIFTIWLWISPFIDCFIQRCLKTIHFSGRFHWIRCRKCAVLDYRHKRYGRISNQVTFSPFT